jgi:uncharacterized protein
MAPQARRRPLADLPDDARQYAVPMRDGALLATDVSLPDGDPPFYALVSRLPYDKAGSEFFMPDIARYWTARGYAVVVQDVRGKARSSGMFDPVNQERDDGYDTLDWVVAQPWARDRVAMIGDSYAGITQWAAAESMHPALVAITPRCTGYDRFDAMYDGGIFSLETAVYWAAETAIDEYLYDYPEPFDWTARPLTEVLTREVGARHPRWIDDWATRVEPYVAPIPVFDPKLQCLHLCGFFDVAVAAHVRAWETAARSGIGHHSLVLDAVDHSWTPLLASSNRARSEPMSDFLDRYNEPLVDFLGTALAGQPQRTATVRWRPFGDVAWNESHTWPPPMSAPMTLWAMGAGRSGGRGSLQPFPGRASKAEWQHNPREPVPSRGIPFHLLTDRHDWAGIADRDDTLLYQTEPLESTLIVGPVRLQCRLASSAASTHLYAVLYDLTADGRMLEISSGRQIAFGPWPVDVTVSMTPVAYQLAQGHRLALSLSSSLFPRFALHPGSDTDAWTEWLPQITKQAVILGKTSGVRIAFAVAREP